MTLNTEECLTRILEAGVPKLLDGDPVPNADAEEAPAINPASYVAESDLAAHFKETGVAWPRSILVTAACGCVSEYSVIGRDVRHKDTILCETETCLLDWEMSVRTALDHLEDIQ